MSHARPWQDVLGKEWYGLIEPDALKKIDESDLAQVLSMSNHGPTGPDGADGKSAAPEAAQDGSLL